MSHILTLATLQNTLPTEDIAKHLNLTTPWTWLAKNTAAEIPLEHIPSPSQIENLRALCDESKADIFITSNHNRRKKLLLADMDSTIVQGETLDDLAAHAGIKDKISAITARAMNGELDFHDAIRERVGLLKDLSADMLDKTLQETPLSQGAKSLVQTMKTGGAHCVLVSGGFTFFTNAIAQQVGFDNNHGNILGIENNRLTGQVADPILDKDAKLTFLNDYAQKQSIDLSNTMTIGDGANDLPMLLDAQNANGLGIGYYAKPAVAVQLINTIRHTDLTSALYAQGYTAEEIIS